MPDVLLAPLVIAYVAIVLALLLFGLNFAYLTWTALRWRRPTTFCERSSLLPRVTVQIPIFNERYVVERAIEAAAALRYPRHLLEIQLLDDSTDDTADIVSECADRVRSDDLRVEHIQRPHRQGFKAGALGAGLEKAQGDFIAIFDVDFVPEPDFLEKTVPVLGGDSSLAFVQTRWGHLNREQSILTRIQALSIDGHFGIEQQAKWLRGHCFNFNGTAGLWRKEAICDSGGWSQRTLTEDLDLSYRAFLRGWSACYLNDVVVRAELPVSFLAYRRQQYRWARGSFQCAVRLVPEIWRSQLATLSKIEATFHLGGYFIHLLLLSLVGIFPGVLYVAQAYPTLLSLFGTMALLNIAALVPSAMFLSAQHLAGRRWYRAVPVVVVLTLVGVGMMVNTAKAAVGAVGGKAGVFRRTPKFGPSGDAGRRWHQLRYQGNFDVIVAVELVIALLCVWTSWQASMRGSLAIATYASIFSAGLAFNATVTIYQAARIAFNQFTAMSDDAGTEADTP